MDSVVATEAYKASAVADSLFFATVDATYYKLVMDKMCIRDSSRSV